MMGMYLLQMFGTAQRLVQQIRQQSSEGRGRQEQRLSYNVVSTLVAVLQELSAAFRQTQNSYVKSECHTHKRATCEYTKG